MPKRGIVLMGQSNGFAGYGEDRADAIRTHPNLWQFKQNGTFEQAPIQRLDFQSGGHPNRLLVAYTFYLIRDYLIPRNPGVDYCILPQSVGGTGFSLWWHAPNAALTVGVGSTGNFPLGGQYYEKTITQMNAFLAAEVGNTIDCVILQNGEQETGDTGSNIGYYHASFGLTDKQAYTRYVTEMIADMSARVTGGRTWPFLIGQMPPDLVYGPGLIGPSADGIDHSGCQYIPLVDAIAEIPGVVSNCAYLSSLYPTKVLCHDSVKTDGGDVTGGAVETPPGSGNYPNGQPDIIMDSGNYWLHTCQAGHHIMAHRAFKAYMKLKGYGTVITAAVSGSASGDAPSNVWMEAPDVIGFFVDDDPVRYGNTVTTTARAEAYDTWFTEINPVTSASEYCQVIGAAKTKIHFTDKPPLTCVDRQALHDLSKYSVTGRTVSALYHRDEMIDNGANQTPGQTMVVQFRHTVYLKLSAPLTNGSRCTIAHSGTPPAFASITFTYNDKQIRAGGIRISMFGMRADDTFKRAYLASRIPAGPNKGVVDFAAAPYSITAAQVIDATTLATVATVGVSLRLAWDVLEPDAFSTTGFDVADLTTGVTVTDITKATSAVVTAPGHTFIAGDKVRFHGIAGMTQINGRGQTGSDTNIWIASTVSSPSGSQFTINMNTSAFTTFSATPIFSEALGGINSKVYKCYNTNRAGTNVYNIDLSTLTTPGTYKIYIPGYGVSDPFTVASDAYSKIAGYLHQGLYSLRLGCDVTTSSWTRGRAVIDGVNGTEIYQSTLIGAFTTESQQAITPTGATIVRAGMGGFSDEGTLTISNLVWSGGTVTATTSAPHGIPNGPYPLRVINCLPAGYNFDAVTSGGANTWATVTGTSTFTYPVASNPGAFSQLGLARTGHLTSTRLTGFRAPIQDAGDNDGPTFDHMYQFGVLPFTFNNIPATGRFTPFTVQKCTELLNATTYAGTDALPPLFHEICWYLDNYRVTQKGNGDIHGGQGYRSLSSQIPNNPESIDLARGWSPLGNRSAINATAFVYASDHYGTMGYAWAAAQVALICQGYGLTTLSNTWRDSAIAAFNRARALATDLTVRDAHYITTLNLPTKMGWPTAQYNDGMNTLNNRIVAAATFHSTYYSAAGALFRLLGSSAGAVYGAIFVDKYCSITPTIGAGSGGSGYAVGDLITLDGGVAVNRTIVRVTAVSGGAVTTVVLYWQGQYTTAPVAPIAQLSTTGSGTGVSFGTGTFGGAYAAISTAPGAYDYAVTPGADATAKTYLLGRTYSTDSPTWSSSATAFNTMISPTGTSNSNYPGRNPDAIIAHLFDVYKTSVEASRDSAHLKSMSGHIQWLSGASLCGKSMITQYGLRSNRTMLHEDSHRMGVPSPAGIVTYGYNAWCAGGIFAFQGLGTTTDAPLTHMADNVTGLYEAGGVQNGSTKLWTPWRFGESYWEYTPQGRGFITIGEFTMELQVSLVCMALYLHGWDGNTGSGTTPDIITQTGSNLNFNVNNSAATGTSTSTMTVPADAQIAIVGVAGYQGTTNGHAAMTLTKGGVDTAMTPIFGADASSNWQSAMFYQVLPDTGTNKTLKWSWAGTSTDPALVVSVTFWKGIDTASPVRDTDAAQGAGWPRNTPTLTAQTSDKIVAWCGFYNSGGAATVSAWNNLTGLASAGNTAHCNGSWASGDPSGSTSVGVQACGGSEGGVVAVVLKPGLVRGATEATEMPSKPQRRD